MEDIPNWIRAFVPLLLLLSTIVFIVIKNHFISRKEFKEFTQKYEVERKELEGKIVTQGRDIVEIKTDVKHMANSLQEIKEFILSPRKRRKD